MSTLLIQVVRARLLLFGVQLNGAGTHTTVEVASLCVITDALLFPSCRSRRFRTDSIVSIRDASTAEAVDWPAAVSIRTVSKAVFTDAAAMLPTPSLIMMIASIEQPPATPQAKLLISQTLNRVGCSFE